MKKRTEIAVALAIVAILLAVSLQQRAVAKAAAFRNQPDRTLCGGYWYNRLLSGYHGTDVCAPENRERFRVMTDMSPSDRPAPESH